ncbi:K(+)-transporting ATPase subunit F [Myroides sp. DF42-4-2]|nr:K(+)-transporting ATPase subunit F [Myroides sp. NP-2]MDM1407478.1 K(+)-transporting ATPase subunit F [Myroides sp. DF42-4-2]
MIVLFLIALAVLVYLCYVLFKPEQF